MINMSNFSIFLKMTTYYVVPYRIVYCVLVLLSLPVSSLSSPHRPGLRSLPKVRSPFLSTPLISPSTKNCDFSRSSLFFSNTTSPDTMAFNALISGFASFHFPESALALFDELRLLSLYPSV